MSKKIIKKNRICDECKKSFKIPDTLINYFNINNPNIYCPFCNSPFNHNLNIYEVN